MFILAQKSSKAEEPSGAARRTLGLQREKCQKARIAPVAVGVLGA